MGAPNEARNEAKQELRRRMRAVRRGHTAADRRSHDAAVVEHLAQWVDGAIDRARPTSDAAPAVPLTVMVYDAVPGEPDVRAFAERRRERGDRVVAPDADPGAVAPVAPAEVDVVLVPGLAFDVAGRRLGRGGGWYDRFLAGLRPGCVVVGVCYDDQLVDEVPVEAHDVRVGAVATPSGVLPGGGIA